MRPCILLALTRTDWIGAARMPRMLARAGFDVVLLGPEGSLAERSEYVSRTAHVAPKATPISWLESLQRTVNQVEPHIVIPGDEMALRLLFRFVLDPPRAMLPAERARLAALIVESLGPPEHYAVSIDKTLLPPAAESIGVRVPRYGIATSPDEAVAHAGTLGSRIVLKRRLGFGSGGVAFPETLERVAREAARMLAPEPVDLGEYAQPQLLVQAFVAGPHHSLAVAALAGRVLASFSWERFVLTRPVNGQTSVLRFVDSPATRIATERIVRHFAMTGLFNMQFIVDEATGEPLLLEINRRVTTHMNLGERVGADLGVALFNALSGNDVPAPVATIPAEDRINVFPREWLRDPDSPNLDRYPVDIPWDEPRLIAAMAAQWRDA
jgi:hypothetical protein